MDKGGSVSEPVRLEPIDAQATRCPRSWTGSVNFWGRKVYVSRVGSQCSHGGLVRAKGAHGEARVRLANSGLISSGGKMRTIARLVVPLAVFAAACGPDASKSSQIGDDLKHDLEASSATLELASPTANYKPMRFVSELEQTNNATPVERVRAPRHVATKNASTQDQQTESPTPEAPSEVQVAQTPSESPQSPTPSNDVPTVPIVAPRPAALPVDYPAADGSGRGRSGRGEGTTGIGIGDVIGVVIRGGGVGDDHCVPPRRGGRGRGFPFPLRLQVVHQISR
jgi:hypothetical protein